MTRVTLNEPMLPEDKPKFDALWATYGPFWLLWTVAKKVEGPWNNFIEGKESADSSLQEAKSKVAAIIKKAAKEITEITW